MNLIDTHCHLCPGIDDGPETLETAVEMCRVAWEDGTCWMAATAHQGGYWPDVVPRMIRAAAGDLRRALERQGIPMTLRPAGEVMVCQETLDQWSNGELLTVANQGKYLLLEFPHGLYIDIRELASALIRGGVRPILAHPERCPELLHNDRRMDELIGQGCLVQVVAESVVNPSNRAEQRALKRWFNRGVVHLIGSDGHSLRRRPPGLSESYRVIRGWVGTRAADRICGTNGLTVLQGHPLRVPSPRTPRKLARLFARFVSPPGG